jgi:hypothetical protein
MHLCWWCCCTSSTTQGAAVHKDPNMHPKACMTLARGNNSTETFYVSKTTSKAALLH